MVSDAAGAELVLPGSAGSDPALDRPPHAAREMITAALVHAAAHRGVRRVTAW
jgi:hypothetical protein